MNCNTLDLSNLILIGAGGFSNVYQLQNGKVLKAIVSKNACQDALLEMNKQNKAYLAWKKLTFINTKDPIVNKAIELVKFSKPFASCNQGIQVDGKKFSCYFIMEKLSGIPFSTLLDLNPNVINQVQNDFKPNDLMLQLSLNSELLEKIYGVTYSKKMVGYNNPPRGYFINDSSNTLQRFGIDVTQIKEIMGFIYGYLFYVAKLIPIDIEMTLGTYGGKYYLNVLDFGMTVDIEDISNNSKLPRTIEFINRIENIELLEKLTIEDISIDLYCDLEDDLDCRRGWDTAKLMFG